MCYVIRKKCFIAKTLREFNVSNHASDFFFIVVFAGPEGLFMHIGENQRQNSISPISIQKTSTLHKNRHETCTNKSTLQILNDLSHFSTTIASLFGFISDQCVAVSNMV